MVLTVGFQAAVFRATYSHVTQIIKFGFMPLKRSWESYAPYQTNSAEPSLLWFARYGLSASLKLRLCSLQFAQSSQR